jgi:small subunit ribosomal protein S8
MLTDPISDMLTRLRNGVLARHQRVAVPHSRLKAQILGLLQQEGYLQDVKEEADGAKKSLSVALRYHKDRRAAIEGLARVSRPGRRVYVGHADIPVVKNGFGMAVLSTSRGVMTDKTAREQKLGGELLFTLW